MTIACKVPSELVRRLDQIAEIRGVSRSQLLRELVEALLDGRVILPLSAPIRTSAREIRASDVSRAVQKRAQLDAAAACRGDLAAHEIDSSTLNLDAVVLRAIRLIAEGR